MYYIAKYSLRNIIYVCVYVVYVYYMHIAYRRYKYPHLHQVILMEREIEKGFNTFVQIEGANHSLSVKGRLIVDVNDEICDIIRDWTEQFDP